MHDSSFTITTVRWSDLGALASIQKQAFRRDLAYRWWMLAFFHLMPGVAFKVARKGDEVVGCIIADTYQGAIRIMNIAVHERHRQQGIGSALMQAAMKEWPGKRVILTVQEENRAARSLYERMGFTRTGFRANYYGRGHGGIEMTLQR